MGSQGALGWAHPERHAGLIINVTLGSRVAELRVHGCAILTYKDSIRVNTSWEIPKKHHRQW